MKISNLNTRVKLTYNRNAYDIDTFESIIEDVNKTFMNMGLSTPIVYTHDMPEDLEELDLDEEFTIKLFCANNDVACEFVAQVTEGRR